MELCGEKGFVGSNWVQEENNERRESQEAEWL